jgi:hypothetical protein
MGFESSMTSKVEGNRCFVQESGPGWRGTKKVVIKEDRIKKDETVKAMQQRLDRLLAENRALVEQRMEEHPTGSIGPNGEMWFDTGYPKKEEDSEKFFEEVHKRPCIEADKTLLKNHEKRTEPRNA